MTGGKLGDHFAGAAISLLGSTTMPAPGPPEKDSMRSAISSALAASPALTPTPIAVAAASRVR
jgi:hypothetical protein